MMFLSVSVSVSVSFAVAARDGLHERWHTRQFDAAPIPSGRANQRSRLSALRTASSFVT